MKQLLTLERERVGGGDGFLSAAQTAAKARGEPIEPVKKKRKENPVGKVKAKPPRRSGISTPATLDDESVVSGTATPFEDEDAPIVPVEGMREIITCKWLCVEASGGTRCR